MNASHDFFKMAVMYYGAAYLPRLRELRKAGTLDLSLDAASAYSLEHPLHYKRDPEFSVVGFENEGVKGKLTGGQVTAIMVFGLWVKTGENEKLAGPLMAAWPIKEALVLAEAQGKKGGVL
jgi:hypothetical protein